MTPANSVTAHDYWPVAFRPLHLTDHAAPVGFLPLDCAALLEQHGLVGEKNTRLTLADRGDVSTRLEAARDILFGAGKIAPPRAELMPVRAGFDGPTIASIDRSALRIFGFWATKVHINGLVRAGADPFPHVWLSRRSASASAFPGTFDTLVAGGQALGVTTHETAVHEAWEEAGIGRDRLDSLHHVRDLAVQYVSKQGFHQEVLAIYDLDLDPAFIPGCTDGEIDESRIFSWPEFRAALAGQVAFKFGSRLVCDDMINRTLRACTLQI